MMIVGVALATRWAHCSANVPPAPPCTVPSMTAMAGTAGLAVAKDRSVRAAVCTDVLTLPTGVVRAAPVSRACR